MRVAISGRWRTEDAIAVLTAAGADHYRLATSSREELAAALESADAIIIGATERLDASLIDQARACRVISRYGIGVDNVDIAAATRRGIAVTCVPDASVEEVSDHAVALLLASGRRLFPLDAAIRSGEWGRQGNNALAAARSGLRRFAQLTIGFVGFGRIGQAVWRKLRGFDCAGVAYDPWLPSQVMAGAGVGQEEDLAAVLAKSDLVTLHLPLTLETDTIIGPEQIRAMKPGACLVNTSRGRLVDETALAAALHSGHLAAAALDVTVVEPVAADSPLLSIPNLILTGHTAYYSAESLVELGRRAADAVLAIVQGKPCTAVVNPDYAQHIR